jgi:hypothetical protein
MIVEKIVSMLVELNKTDHVMFGLITVAIMAGVGATIGFGMELIFKALGIKTSKIEIHH